jgi:hypothetical protein
MTTTPDGRPTTADGRLGEIAERYGPGDLVTQFIEQAGPSIRAAVGRVERRLSGCTQPM